MEWTDSAIVLHVGHFRESDMWLRLLFRRRGICNVFAFGGSRSRRRFCGCLDVCNTVTCRVKQGRSYLTLEEGVLQQGPQALRADWARLGMAMNCARFLEALGVTQESAPATYALYGQVLECLEESTAPPLLPLLPLFFRWRLAAEQGFAPALGVCVQCGTVENLAYFLMDEGHVLCADCGNAGNNIGSSVGGTRRYMVRLSTVAFATLAMVLHTLPSLWLHCASELRDRRGVAQAIDGFVQYHLGIAWDEGRFRRV